MSHVHHWEKTGEFFATGTPIWVWTCEECRAVGEAPDDGGPIDEKGVVANAGEWEQHFGIPMRRYRERLKWLTRHP